MQHIYVLLSGYYTTAVLFRKEIFHISSHIKATLFYLQRLL